MERKNESMIIIPAYNEQDNIERVVKHLTENYPEYDYVVINDGSMDKTSEICHSNHYNIMDLPVNLGLAGGFQTGMKYAYQKGYDCAVQFDADGSTTEEYIAAMIRKIEEGNDIVIASRFVEEKKPSYSKDDWKQIDHHCDQTYFRCKNHGSDIWNAYV